MLPSPVTHGHLHEALLSLCPPASPHVVQELLQCHESWVRRHSQAIRRSCQAALQETHGRGGAQLVPSSLSFLPAAAPPTPPFIHIPPPRPVDGHSHGHLGGDPGSPARSVASASSFSTQWSAMSTRGGGPAGVAQLCEDLNTCIGKAWEGWQNHLTRYQVSGGQIGRLGGWVVVVARRPVRVRATRTFLGRSVWAATSVGSFVLNQ